MEIVLATSILSSSLIYAWRDKFYFHPINTLIKTKNKIIKVKGNYALTNVQKIKKNKCLIISCGNSGNISYYDDLLEQLKTYDGDIYIYEYSGFGLQKGTVSINNCVKSHMFWLETLSKDYNIIDLWGFSMGGAIVVKTISSLNNNDIIINKINNIYLHGTFSKIKNIVKTMFPMFGKIYDLFNINDLNTIDSLKHKNFNNKNITILHSKDDEIIPFNEAKLNYNKCKKLNLNTKFIKIEGDHNNYIFDIKNIFN